MVVFSSLLASSAWLEFSRSMEMEVTSVRKRHHTLFHFLSIFITIEYITCIYYYSNGSSKGIGALYARRKT